MSFPFAVHGWQIQCGEVVLDQIVDIRQPELFVRGRLPGAINLPYERLQDSALDLLDSGRTVLVVDPGGARAAEMATWLRARGFQAGFLEGGLSRWTGDLESGAPEPAP